LRGRKSGSGRAYLTKTVWVRQANPVLNTGALISNFLYQPKESCVEKDYLILCIINHPGKLIRMQPRIDSVQNHCSAAHAVIEHQVPVSIPGKRPYPIGGLQAHASKRFRESAGITGSFSPTAAEKLPAHPSRNNLCLSVMTLSVHYKRGNKQRLILHAPKHSTPPFSA
jgi:hypothetical protein